MSNVGLLVAAQNGNGKGEGKGASAATTPPYITGRLYQAVQMTGLDGKKLMKLLPVSKPVENLKPVVLSPGMSHGLEGNVSGYLHDNVKTLFTNTTTTPVDKTTELKTSLSQPVVLLKPLVQLEKLKIASVVKENPATSAVSGIQGSYSADRSSLQEISTPVSSGTSGSDTAVLSTKNIPLTVKSPTLLSGHHLQIPAHAEVKSVPATFLPPVIQQEILARATSSNTSRTFEVTNPPAVIYVSPVNAVKMPASRPLQNISLKPVAGVLNSLVLTTPQKAVNSSALEVSASDSKKNQRSPMKWVVHEQPQSSASCLVPVKSSNMASKILKALIDKKNIESSSASILPACSNSLDKSHAKTTMKKDDALVMYDGKVYLLTKKEGNVLSASNHSKHEGSHFGKQTSALISSATNSTITNQVVNLVLSKTRGTAPKVKEPNSHENMIPHLESEVKKRLISESTLSVMPCDNLQISSTSQQRAMPLSENVSVGTTIFQNSVTKESTHSKVQKAGSSKADVNAVLLPAVHDTLKAEDDKIEIPIEMKHRKKQQKDKYLHLRKKFGLFKEERVYLTRILSIPPKSSEATGAFGSTQMNETCNLLQLTQLKTGKEEKIFRGQREELNVKRKIRTPVLENGKKKKKDAETVLDSMLECNNSYPAMEKTVQPNAVSEHETTIRVPQCSQREDWVPNPCVQSNEENSVLNPTLYCHENEVALNEDSFPFSPPDLEETIKDEKIMRLKNLLREQEAALEAIRKK